jgi:chromosome segregation ATPase
MKQRIILAITVAGLLWGCHAKENAMLLGKVDSLNQVVVANKKTLSMLDEVGVMLDSIESDRMILRSGVVEGTKYSDYSQRLNDLNEYIETTQTKLGKLESEVRKSKANSSMYASLISKLKIELEGSKQQIAALELEVGKARENNMMLTHTLTQKDSLLAVNAEVIKVKEQDVAGMELKVQEINQSSTNTQADLYFAQGQALELAAARTKFAPRKKKETQREALELYKRAYSLGKMDSKERIEKLEKVLS